MASAPDELSSVALFWSVPPDEPFPPELHGKPVLVVAGVYAGSVEDGEPVVQPLRELGEPLIDLSGPWPWLGLQSGFDALFPKGGLLLLEVARARRALRGRDRRDRRLRGAPSDAAHRHRDLASRRRDEPRSARRTTAYGGRDATFLVTGEVSWTDPAQNDEAIAWGREFWDAMGKHSTGGLYLNFPGLGEEKEALVRAGYGANYERLAELKAKYDPDEPLPDEPEHHAELNSRKPTASICLASARAVSSSASSTAAAKASRSVFEPSSSRTSRAVVGIELGRERKAGFETHA